MSNGNGLNLPGVIGIGAQQEDYISQTWETIDDVELEASRSGIPPLPKPGHVIPVLTNEMLMVSSNSQYTDMQLMIKAWKDYVADRYGRIRARQLQVENEMNNIAVSFRAPIRAKRVGLKKTDDGYYSDKRIEDEIELQPRYRELKLKLQMLVQEELVIESRLKALSGDLAIISRAVELRKQEWEENRSNAGQPRGYSPSRPLQGRAYPPELPPRIG